MLQAACGTPVYMGKCCYLLIEWTILEGRYNIGTWKRVNNWQKSGLLGSLKTVTCLSLEKRKAEMAKTLNKTVWILSWKLQKLKFFKKNPRAIDSRHFSQFKLPEDCETTSENWKTPENLQFSVENVLKLFQSRYHTNSHFNLINMSLKTENEEEKNVCTFFSSTRSHPEPRLLSNVRQLEFRYHPVRFTRQRFPFWNRQGNGPPVRAHQEGRCRLLKANMERYKQWWWVNQDTCRNVGSFDFKRPSTVDSGCSESSIVR